jgi:hypothetical protein
LPVCRYERWVFIQRGEIRVSDLVGLPMSAVSLRKPVEILKERHYEMCA